MVDDNNNGKFSISGQMTAALIVYATVFSRYALAVTPKNYLLFGCHVTNFVAQTTQGYRYLQYWQYVSVSIVSFILFGWITDLGLQLGRTGSETGG